MLEQGQNIKTLNIQKIAAILLVLNLFTILIFLSFVFIEKKELMESINALEESINALESNISTAKLAESAVTTLNIADASITVADLADFAVTTAKLADSAVTSEKIADGTIVMADIDIKSVQSRISETCPTGQYMQGINADGTINCAAVPALSCQVVTSERGNSIRARCPPGTFMTGGGMSEHKRQGDHLSFFEDSRPDKDNFWFCDTGYGTGDATCYAVCCKVQ